MRVFKPLQLSLQHKTFTWQKKNQLAVTLLLGFPFDSDQEIMLEQDLWKMLPDQLGKDAFLDMCMPKPQGEVLVYGSYYAPGGKPVNADEVNIRMGTVDKSLAVIGDRYWRNLLPPTDPEAFSEMPINYQHAFGGKDYTLNTAGKGLDEVEVDGEMFLPMPNIEDPDHLVTSTDVRPEPAGFGPLDVMWQQRTKKMGTYDETWQREYAPGYAPDLDWTFFNAAPADQWIDEFWRGDESFQLNNMHPAKDNQAGKLPSFRGRCFIQQKQQQGSVFREVEMRAETVCLFPNVETGVLIYRGVIEVIEDDATDVEHLLLAYENLEKEPRSKDYYEEALRNRLDDSKTFKYMMFTRDIIPETERCGFARMLDMTDKDDESELAKNLDAKVATEKQKALEVLAQQKEKFKAQLEAAGIDPAPYMAKFELPDGKTDDPEINALMETIDKILPGVISGDTKNLKLEEVDFSKFDDFSKQMDGLVETKKLEIKQQLSDITKKVEGTEIEAQVRAQVEESIKQIDEPPLLPRPNEDEMFKELYSQLESVEKSTEVLRAKGVAEDQLPDLGNTLDELEQKLKEISTKIKELYLDGAHYVTGKPPHTVPMDIVQHRFEEALTKGHSLVGSDLSGIDASGMDLTGVDLSDCYLEYANLSQANLTRASLKRAIITHANLTEANLTDANAEQANLGDSCLRQANFSNTNLREAVLSKSDMTGARFIGCNLNEVVFLEAKMTGIDLSHSNIPAINFLNIDFTGARFVDCHLKHSNFIQCTLDHTNFSKADLTSTNFIECNLDNSQFVEAHMINVRFPGGCTLRDCNFDKALLDMANMRDIDAENSRFEEASFNQADFSGANLQNTKFYAAHGKRALFMKTDLGGADFSSVNLMEGSMMKARLTNADLRYSNFYAVDFMNATVGGTDFTGANMDLTIMEDWRPGE